MNKLRKKSSNSIKFEHLQGRIEIQGSPADLAESEIDFVQYMGLVEDPTENIDLIENPVSRTSSISSRKSNGSSHSKHENNEKKDDGVQMEESSKGKIKGSVAWGYFSSGTHWLILISLAVIFPIVEIFASGSDYWLSIWYVILGFSPPFEQCSISFKIIRFSFR